MAREAPDMLIALTTKNKAYLCFEAAISVIDCCMTIYSFNCEAERTSLLREGYVQQEEEMLRANDEYERNTEHIWQTERKKAHARLEILKAELKEAWCNLSDVVEKEKLRLDMEREFHIKREALFGKLRNATRKILDEAEQGLEKLPEKSANALREELAEKLRVGLKHYNQLLSYEIREDK